MLKGMWFKLWDRDNLLKKQKKPELTGVKIPKPATLIVRSIYHYRKQIKIDYETQFLTDLVLNDKIKKNQLKNNTKNNLSQLVKYYSWVKRLK